MCTNKSENIIILCMCNTYVKYSAAEDTDSFLVSLVPFISRISSGVSIGVQFTVFHELLQVFHGTSDWNELNIKNTAQEIIVL